MYGLKETKLLLLLHFFILGDASCESCSAFDVLRLNQCYFYHQPAADPQFVHAKGCFCLCVCASLLRWLSVLRDKCGGKSPFLFFQDHYLSFQSQRRAQGSRAGGGGREGLDDCIRLDAYETSNTGDWFYPVVIGELGIKKCKHYSPYIHFLQKRIK